MSLLASPGDSAYWAVVKESFETVLFLHHTRDYAPPALRTSTRMGGHNKNTTRDTPRKNAKAGMPRPIAKANPNGQDREAGEMNPIRRLWKFFDGVILPFLIFCVLGGLVLELENDRFHMTETSLQRRRVFDSGQGQLPAS
jgi:hypothetical protein